MTTLVNKGTGYAVSASTTSVNTNAGPDTNTWQVVNVSGNTAAFNAFTTNTSVTMTTGVVIPTGTSQLVTGDFGPAYQGNVWISTILAAGTGTVYVTPVIAS